MEKRITGHTQLLALIGSPVGHSGSPAMYNYSFDKLGLDYAYVAFDVKESDVKQALKAMLLFHMRGMNVTMPDKVEAARHMDELSPAAQIIGAVNTIVNEDGKLIGYNTINLTSLTGAAHCYGITIAFKSRGRIKNSVALIFEIPLIFHFITHNRKAYGCILVLLNGYRRWLSYNFEGGFLS